MRALQVGVLFRVCNNDSNSCQHGSLSAFPGRLHSGVKAWFVVFRCFISLFYVVLFLFRSFSVPKRGGCHHLGSPRRPASRSAGGGTISTHSHATSRPSGHQKFNSQDPREGFDHWFFPGFDVEVLRASCYCERDALDQAVKTCEDCVKWRINTPQIHTDQDSSRVCRIL